MKEEEFSSDIELSRNDDCQDECHCHEHGHEHSHGDSHERDHKHTDEHDDCESECHCHEHGHEHGHEEGDERGHKHMHEHDDCESECHCHEHGHEHSHEDSDVRDHKHTHEHDDCKGECHCHEHGHEHRHEDSDERGHKHLHEYDDCEGECHCRKRGHEHRHEDCHDHGHKHKHDHDCDKEEHNHKHHHDHDGHEHCHDHDCCCHDHCGHEHNHDGHEHGHGCACCDDTPIKIDKKQKVWQVDKSEVICIAVSAVFLIAGLIIDKVVGERLFGAYLACYILAFVAVAWRSIYEGFKGLLDKDIFNENTLMNVASIGAFCIGEFAEGVMVMLLYTLGETIQGISVRKSKKSIAELLDIKVDKSNLVLADGGTALVDTSSLKIGDRVLVKVGEKTPVDGRIVEGASSFDYSKLTGESIPVERKIGDEVLGGTINLDNAIYVEVEKEEKDATVSKILKLVESAQQNKPKAEKFVRKFAKVYTPIVFALALIISVFLPMVVSSVTYQEAIKKGLVFLVISCPCALVISTPLTYFGGIGSASRRGVLVKGGNYLELLNRVDEVCFDKTGTLTEGKLEVKEVYAKDSKEQLLAVAGACESSSNHPIAKCIAEYCMSALVARNVKEIAGEGLVCEVDGKQTLCGNARLLDKYGVGDYVNVSREYSIVHVAFDGRYLGYFGIADKVREKSKAVISDLKMRGIVTTMLTGDNPAVASAVKEQLGVDGYLASLMPQDKSEYVKSKIDEGKSVMFVGDGLNDAPAIKTASVGVCVSGMGNDASVEASDMVLIGGNIDRLSDAFDVAKKTKKIIVENIVMALGFKFAIMAVCMFVNPLMWLAVVADVGVCLLTILNSMRLLKKAKRKKEHTA